MTVNIVVSAEDWQAAAAELAGENMRLRAALQAAGRELNQLESEAGGESGAGEAGSPPGPNHDPDNDPENDPDDERRS